MIPYINIAGTRTNAFLFTPAKKYIYLIKYKEKYLLTSGLHSSQITMFCLQVYSQNSKQKIKINK